MTHISSVSHTPIPVESLLTFPSSSCEEKCEEKNAQEQDEALKLAWAWEDDSTECGGLRWAVQSVRYPSDDFPSPLEASAATIRTTCGDLFDQIKYLYLRGCPLKVFPKELGKMTSLIILDLSKTTIETPPDVSMLRHLEILYFRHAHIRTPPDVRGCCNLKTLLLGNSWIQEPPDVSQNSVLEEFECSETSIQKPPNISNNLALIYLILGKTQIQTMPDICHQTHLKILDLTDTVFAKNSILSEKYIKYRESLKLDFATF